jgi:hypothetical protein
LEKYGNEIVGDVEVGHWEGPKTVHFLVEAVARLPAQRILFAIGADVQLEV